DVAPKLKAGVVWINATNLFDAAAGFGGYRESGFGREGGREGMWEYLKRKRLAASDSNGSGEAAAGRQQPAASSQAPAARRQQPAPSSQPPASGSQALPELDRTPKLYIGGKQARPDSG